MKDPLHNSLPSKGYDLIDKKKKIDLGGEDSREK